MKVDIKHQRGIVASSCVGLISNALPEAQCKLLSESSQTGVSTRNAHIETKPETLKMEDVPHWYALRTTYGREKKAYDYMIAKGVVAFYPTIIVVKQVKGKRKVVSMSRIPNIFFAYGTEEQLKTFVYDNVNLPFLRFYYRHLYDGNIMKRIPMIIPDYQINSLKIICESEVNDIIISCDEIDKFKKGQLVRIVEGTFKGVVGKVARYRGQQRVGVVVDGMLTCVTAYIPSAFIQPIK